MTKHKIDVKVSPALCCYATTRTHGEHKKIKHAADVGTLRLFCVALLVVMAPKPRGVSASHKKAVWTMLALLAALVAAAVFWTPPEPIDDIINRFVCESGLQQGSDCSQAHSNGSGRHAAAGE